MNPEELQDALDKAIASAEAWREIAEKVVISDSNISDEKVRKILSLTKMKNHARTVNELRRLYGLIKDKRRLNRFPAKAKSRKYYKS